MTQIPPPRVVALRGGQPIDEQSHAGRAQFLQAMTTELSEAVTVRDCAAVTLRRFAEILPVMRAGIWLMTLDDQHLELLAQLHYEDSVNEYAMIPADTPMVIGDIIDGGVPVFLDSREEREHPNDPALTFVGLPLTAKGRIRGGLLFSYFDPHLIDADEQMFLTLLAQQCALAMERSRLYDDLQTRARHWEVLAGVSQALNHLDLRSAMQEICRVVGTAFGEGAGMSLADGDLLIPVAAYHPNAEDNALLQRMLNRPFPAHLHVVRAFRTNQTVNVSDCAHPLNEGVIAEYMAHSGMMSQVIAPLRDQSAAIGVINLLGGADRGPFSAADARLLEELAERVSLTIVNARAHEATQANATRWKMLAEATEALDRLGYHEALQAVCDVVAAGIGDAVGFYELVGHDLLSVASQHRDPHLAQSLKALLSMGPAPKCSWMWRVVDTNAPVRLQFVKVEDREAEPYHDVIAQFASSRDHSAVGPHDCAKSYVRSLAVLPIHEHDRVVGVFVLARDIWNRPHTDEDHNFAVQLVARISLTIQNATAHETLRANASRWQVLAEATRRMNELQLDDALTGVCRSIAELLGDAAVLSLLEGPVLRVTAAHHRDPVAHELLQRFLGPGMIVVETYRVARALRENRIIRHHEPITDGCDYGREIGVSSMVVLPLRSPTGAFGTLSVLRDLGHPIYSAADIELLEQLAERASLTLQNAQARKKDLGN